jgi:NADH-quinone oxidoreductase subunit C
MLDINVEEVASTINSKVSSANAKVHKPVEDGAGDSSVEVSADSIHEVASALKENGFNVLQVISGVDYPEYIEVNYMFARFDLNNPGQFTLKVRVSDKNTPKLDSITDLYPAANWQERECYDMVGVEFNNHPDHRRILCPDDWEGFPLRKDYKVQEVYRGMKVEPEEKMNIGDREFAKREGQA